MTSRAFIAGGAGLVLLLASCGTVEPGRAAPDPSGISSPPSRTPTVQDPEFGPAPTSADSSPSAPASTNPSIETSSLDPGLTDGPASSELEPSAEPDPVAQDLLADLTAGLAVTTAVTGYIEVGVAGQSERMAFAQILEDGVPSALTLDMTVDGEEIEIRYVDDVVYAGGSFSDEYDVDWVAVTEDSEEPYFALAYHQFSASIEQAGPAWWVGLVEIVDDVAAEGDDRIAGIPTQRYSMTFDVDQVTSPDLDDATLDWLLGLRAAGIETVEMQLWMDDQQRLVQVLQVYPLAGQRMTTTLRMTDFDEPAEIVAPDPADVYEG